MILKLFFARRKFFYFLLFVFVVFSFSFVLFLNYKSEYYKKFVIRSFIGNLGDVYFTFTHLNNDLIMDIKHLFKDRAIFFKNFNTILRINNKDVFLKLFIYDKNNSINEVLYNQFSSTLLLLENNNHKLRVKFNLLNSGFLNVVPMMFLNENSAKYLGFDTTLNKIAIKTSDINNTLSIMRNLSKKYNLTFKFVILKEKYKNISNIINYFNGITKNLYFIILLGIVSIILLINEIIFLLNKKNLEILYFYGMSIESISFKLSIIIWLFLLLAFISAFVIIFIVLNYLNFTLFMIYFFNLFFVFIFLFISIYFILKRILS